MNKENSFWKAHNGILFNHEEEWNYAVCINTSEAHKRGALGVNGAARGDVDAEG